MRENKGFCKVSGGYEKIIRPGVREFIPEMCAASFDETSGTVEMYKPYYPEKRETGAAKIGVNRYQYETEKPQTGADFELSISHYGKNILRPLRDGLTLKGRGIQISPTGSKWYYVTDLALSKLEKQYKILYESRFD